MSEWNIPQSFTPVVGELCPKGTFIECKICSAWDEDGKKFSCVRMRKKFWYGYFTDHIRSARHKNNLAKKATYEQAVIDHESESGRKPKRMKQTVLSFVPSNPTRYLQVLCKGCLT